MTSTKHQAPSTKHQAPSTKHQAPSTKHQALTSRLFLPVAPKSLAILVALSIFGPSTALASNISDSCETGETQQDGNNKCAEGSVPPNHGTPGASRPRSSDSSSNTVEEVYVTGKELNHRAQANYESAVDFQNAVSTQERSVLDDASKIEEIHVLGKRGPNSCTGSRISTSAGNPSSTLTGTKSLFERDYYSSDSLPIRVEREYEAGNNGAIRPFGRGWDAQFLGYFQQGVADANGFAEVFLRDSIGAYSFMVNFDTKEVRQMEYFSNSAMLHYEADEDAWYLTHPQGQQSRFAKTPFEDEYVLRNTTELNGTYLSYVYGSYRNLPVEIRHSAGYGITLNYQYFGEDSVISSITDPHGEVWNYQYDSSGRLTSAYDPQGYRDRYTYDSSHNLTSVYSKKGDVIGQWTYDSQGRTLTSRKFDGSHLVEFSYASSVTGDYHYTWVDDEYGRRTKYTSGLYQGRPLLLQKDSTSDDCPTSNVEVDYYAATGLLMEVTDGAGLKTTYTYDDYNRRETITLSDTSGGEYTADTVVREMSYVANTHLVDTTQLSVGSQHINLTNYDYCLEWSSTCKYGLITRVERTDLLTGSQSLVTTIDYQVTDGIVTRVTQANGSLEQQIIYSATTGRPLQFFSGGRLIKEITGYTVDGRVTGVRYPGLYTETFTYDDRGQLSQYVKSTGSESLSTAYIYDEDGLLSGVTSDAGIAKVGTEYYYNENGQPSQTRHTAPLPPEPPAPPTCTFPCFNEL